MLRRLVAHLYDVVLLFILVIPIYVNLDAIIYNQNLNKAFYLGVVFIILVIFYLVFGLLSLKLEGNVGHFLEKLRVVATKGHLTSFRLFLKNLFSFIAYIPLMALLIRGFVHYQEVASAFNEGGIKACLTYLSLPLMIVSVSLIVIKMILNIYLGSRFKQSFFDRIFDVKTVYKKHKVITIADFKDAANYTK